MDMSPSYIAGVQENIGTDKQRTTWQRIQTVNLATAKAYQMRLILQDIYDITNSRVAQRKLHAWCRWVRRVTKKHPSLLFHEMVKCAGMIGHHLEGILAHWRNQTANGFIQALNSVFSAVKLKARGLRSSDNLIDMLYFTAGELRSPVTHRNY